MSNKTIPDCYLQVVHQEEIKMICLELQYLNSTHFLTSVMMQVY